MARKPASMYRDITQHAYTRKEYTGGIPQSTLLQFEMGTVQRDYPVYMLLVPNERAQFRSQSLEAGRISATRHLEKHVGKNNFYLKVRVVPHHILRENKQATGAGADRVSQGMRRAFGTNVGQAARAKAGQALFELRTTKEFAKHGKEALRKAGMKMTSPCRVTVIKGLELLNE
jgi:large subunit ribosomal protein L10e